MVGGLAVVGGYEERSFVSWDETQHIGGLPSDAIVMAWRSSREGRFAVSNGRRLINADQGVYYFDHYQGDESTEPKAFGGGHHGPSLLYIPLHVGRELKG